MSEYREWTAEERKELEALRRLAPALQAKIDELMFEYCPDDMTEEQIKEWSHYQRVTQHAIIDTRAAGCQCVDDKDTKLNKCNECPR